MNFHKLSVSSELSHSGTPACTFARHANCRNITPVFSVLHPNMSKPLEPTCMFMPSFAAKLASDEVSTVMLAGCGGGFDFVHSMLIYAQLKAWGKKVIIGSYSFGDPNLISKGDSRQYKVIYEGGKFLDELDAGSEEGRHAKHYGTKSDATVKLVDARCIADAYYCPEVALAEFLDATYPEDAPHSLYAYYARAFAPRELSKFYGRIVEKHNINAFLLFDGGSDGLMRGDEAGLGDIIEDAVSIHAVASLRHAALHHKILISVGLGADRFNDVSDAASLRAIAELTALGGYLGALAVEPRSTGLQVYQAALHHIYSKQAFRSIVSASIVAAAEGDFGKEMGHSAFRESGRVRSGDGFTWPLMSMLWAFDVNVVHERSLVTKWLHACETSRECHHALELQRRKLFETGTMRKVEDLPRHEEMVADAIFSRRS